MTIVTSILDFPDEVMELKQAAADFVNRRILPHEVEINTTGEVPEAIQPELREGGYYGLTIPAR